VKGLEIFKQKRGGNFMKNLTILKDQDVELVAGGAVGNNLEGLYKFRLDAGVLAIPGLTLAFTNASESMNSDLIDVITGRGPGDIIIMHTS
jgi:hypothetical protein